MLMQKRSNCNKAQVFKDVKGCNVVKLSCMYVAAVIYLLISGLLG